MHNPTSGAAIRAVSIVLLALAVWSLPTLALADSTNDVTWSVRAAITDTEPNRQNFAYQLVPGQQIEDVLVVTNNGDATLRLDTYASDGFTTDSGQLDVLPRAEASQRLGTWIKPAQPVIILEPLASTNVGFTLTVPDNATPGDYTAGIITSLAVSEDTGVSIDRRLGLRILVRVSGETHTRLAITDAMIHYHEAWNPFAIGSGTVSYTVLNIGNTRAAATQAVTIEGPFGIVPVTAPSPEDVPDLLPGERWRVTVTVDHLPPLLWLATHITLAPIPPPDFAPANAIEPTTADAV